MTTIKGKNYADQIDILAGGTPCQSFSTAGNRGGLADPRGGLMLAFVRLAFSAHAKWVLWENVPGVLFTDKGRAFAALLSAITRQQVDPPPRGWRNSGICTGASDGYGVAWRVLDAQFTGAPGHPSAVPQRRRRVWLVAHHGAGWERAAGVLFDSDIDTQYRPPHGCREAPPAAGGAGGHPPICLSGNLAFHRQKLHSRSPAWQYRVAQTVTCTDVHCLITPGGIRRFLPVEEERLFGFPDGYTAIEYKGRPASPYARHNVLGNSWCVNCARWICERIDRSIKGTL
jgi:DNA (cytosine-5)-methyltransferase 1